MEESMDSSKYLSESASDRSSSRSPKRKETVTKTDQPLRLIPIVQQNKQILNCLYDEYDSETEFNRMFSPQQGNANLNEEKES